MACCTYNFYFGTSHTTGITEILATPARTIVKTHLNKFAISSHTALKLATKDQRWNLKIIYEYKLDILPNTKVSVAKDDGKNYLKVKPPLVRHL